MNNPNGNTVIMIIFVVATFMILLLLAFILIILFAYRKRQMSFVIQLEAIKTNAEKELLKTQLEIQEQTFQYVSRDIHDNIGQFISLAKLQLNTLDFNQLNLVKEKIGHSADLMTKALDDLRDLSRSLNSDLVRDNGLLAAIDLQIMHLRRLELVEVSYEVTGETRFLDEQKEIFTLRIIQEAINNIIRHSAAFKVSIRLIYGESHLTLSLADNGKGFDTSIPPGRQSYGISNMTKRASLIGATFNIRSSRGVGTTVLLTVPY
ncbi:MAG TPA: ATP-binding protein [Puia sp.]|jgi:two-component system NarL family sensor kinase|nr:ATP-binding protein [Puia sp.]